MLQPSLQSSGIYTIQAHYDTATLPNQWKHALVQHIFKKGNRCNAINYRQLFLTWICCKLLEHVITWHIMHHGETNSIRYTPFNMNSEKVARWYDKWPINIIYTNLWYDRKTKLEIITRPRSGIQTSYAFQNIFFYSTFSYFAQPCQYHI